MLHKIHNKSNSYASSGLKISLKVKLNVKLYDHLILNLALLQI